MEPNSKVKRRILKSLAMPFLMLARVRRDIPKLVISLSSTCCDSSGYPSPISPLAQKRLCYCSHHKETSDRPL
jgi:hypothetical protein